MFPTKQYLVFHLLFLTGLLHMNNGLQCKLCQKNDPSCILGQKVESRECVNDGDFCFSWFDRKGSEVGVHRDCISSDMAEYKAMKQMIGHRNSGCVKSINGLDCFTFCAEDNCN